MNENNLIRLQKYLADNDVASRRKCEEYILSGKVTVNGKTITELGTKVNPKKDVVAFKEREIKNNENKEYSYILINKPIDCVTTVKDQFGRNTVIDLIGASSLRVDCEHTPLLRPVGRLDMYTSGALILTDDGDFIYKVTHPKHEIKKTYNVTIKGEITKQEVEQLKNGVDIGGFITSKADVKILKYDSEIKRTRIEITIHEGKNRQVRKMLESLDKKVLALHRSKIGNIDLQGLKIGEWRSLKPKEIKSLLQNNF